MILKLLDACCNSEDTIWSHGDMCVHGNCKITIQAGRQESYKYNLAASPPPHKAILSPHSLSTCASNKSAQVARA